MASKSNKAFSLLEVMITVAILSTAIVFTLRAFATVLSSVRFSQNIALACLLAEDKMWEAQVRQKENEESLEPTSGKETIQGRDFNWDYEATKIPDLNLIDLKFNVNWKEKIREKEYVLNFVTRLIPKKAQ